MDIDSPQPKHFKPFSWAHPLLSLCTFLCHTTGCGYRIPCLWPTGGCSCSWPRCVCFCGWQDTDRIPQPQDVNLDPSLFAQFLSSAGGRPWLFPPPLAGPFGHSTHLSVAPTAIPWLCSCFPTGMLSPHTGSRLAPVPSPMMITCAGSAVSGCPATAPCFFPLAATSWARWLETVVAFLEHPTSQGLATWA